MVFVHLLFALVVSLILTSVFVLILGRKRLWPGYLLFFIVIFLASWAGGVWLHPIGPRLWGAYLFSFLIVGLIFALLLAATRPPTSRGSTVELVENEQKVKEEEVATILGGFFWIVLIFLAGAILFRYLWRGF
jgi:membrane associated rhomboid family serine protease